jgi:tetratricopeptide (TPR) repeat protein
MIERRILTMNDAAGGERYEKIQSAISLRHEGKHEGAIHLLCELSKEEDSESALVALLLGDSYWELGDLDRAIAWFKQVTQLKPKSEKASLGLFFCLWQAGKQVEAIDEAKRLVSHRPSAEYRELMRAIVKAIDDSPSPAGEGNQDERRDDTEEGKGKGVT